MSKGGWARLRKQQQESTQSQSDDGAYNIQVHKYKNNIVSSEQQVIAAHLQIHNTPPPQYTTTLATTPPISTASSPFSSTTASSLSPPPTRDPMLPPLHHGNLRTSKLRQIVRRWKALSAKQIASRSPRSTTTSSTSSSMLNCISFSSFQSFSDHEDEAEADDGGKDVVDIPSDSALQSAKIPASPLLHSQSRSVQAAESQSSCRPSMKSTQCIGKERDSSCEILPSARRTQSCPKLSWSPLSSCAASPMRMYGDAQEEEELESLQPKKEEAGRGTKLRRSASSPLSKQPSTPKGYLALYVGEERKRFLVKANSVNHPLFSVLLEKAKEEFGFDQKGALNIPCEIAFFQHIMLLVESNHKSL